MLTLDRDQIERARQVNLIHLASQCVELHGTATEKYGPCPKCGGTDRFHVKESGWFCRQCKKIEDNKGIFYDPIEFVRWKDNCTFQQAVEKLTGPLVYLPVTHVKPEVRQRRIDPTWQQMAREVVEKAHDTLMESKGTTLGPTYLFSRCLEPQTWLAFRLGYVENAAVPGTDGKQRAPAIVIPWYANGELVAVRFRFLEQQAGHRITAMHGSSFRGRLYGGQAMSANETYTMVLCEGEINAMSLWQVCRPWGWNVLCFGSETAKLSQAAIDYATKYDRVVVWMDNPKLVKTIMHEIPGSYGVHSPVWGDDKLDANSLLQSGTLGQFLVTVRGNACRTHLEREVLRIRMANLERVPGALDDNVRSVLDWTGKVNP
jgi:hypothetical protein